MEMKRSYAPSYYGAFRCLADRCRHSCCIDWEIDIDEETMAKYRALGGDILGSIAYAEGSACFRLGEGGRCPHLDDRGLCRIILAHGEEYLSEICRRHPRFWHTAGERLEVGLGLACEEACRLALTHDAPFSLVEIEGFEAESGADAEETSGFDPIPQRNEIIAAIENSALPLEDKLAELKGRFSIPELYSGNGWIDRLLALEILDSEWERALRAARAAAEAALPRDFARYFERLLVYFVFRHVSPSRSQDELRARLGFALFSVEAVMHLFCRERERSEDTLLSLARLYSAEIEYSLDNTDELIFDFACAL